GWDDELLRIELGALREDGFSLELIGFDPKELANLLAGDTIEGLIGDAHDEETGDDADDVPEVPATPVSRAGDVWAIGAHRLICGDAADADVIAALMAGERAALCFTSPPYGNQRDYTSGGISDWDALMRGVFAQLPMAVDGQVLVNLGLIHRDNEV